MLLSATGQIAIYSINGGTLTPLSVVSGLPLSIQGIVARSDWAERALYIGFKQAFTVTRLKAARREAVRVHTAASRAWDTSQPLIPTDERSGLQTHIAGTESVSLCVRMRS